MRAIGERWKSAGWTATIQNRDPEAGTTCFHNARGIFAALGDPVLWEVVRGLAIASAMLGDHDAALRLCDEAERLAPDATARAKVWNTRGVSCSYLRRDEEARRWAEKAMAATSDEAVHRTARQTVGISLLRAGRPREALPLLKDPANVAWARLAAGDSRGVLEIEPGPRPRVYAYRARALLALGRGREARAELRRGARMIEQGRALRDSDEARAAFVGSAHDVHELQLELESAAGRWDAAFRAAEASRARSFLDFAAAPRARHLAHLRTSERARFGELEARIAGLQKAAKDSPELARLEDERRIALRRYDRERLERAKVQPRRPLSAREVCARLGPGEALVQYQALDDALLAFVFRRGRFSPVRLRAKPADVLAAAQDLARALDLARRDERRGARAFADWHFGALGDALLAPLPLDGASRLVVVPHGALHLVPFAALRIGGRPAIERLEVAHAPSSSVLATLRTRARRATARSARCLLVLDPTRSLPHAAAEEEALRRRFGKRLTVLDGGTATREAVRELAPSHEVLHFATHAVWRPDRAELSYLELADGERLTASELSALDLSRVRAAVLSACDSGRGDFARAEEMFGLPRAFLCAGAASVVATLWPIEDHAGLGAFMDGLYASGVSVAAAQRRAAAAGEPESRWAAWIAMGDPR